MELDQGLPTEGASGFRTARVKLGGVGFEPPDPATAAAVMRLMFFLESQKIG